MGLPAGRLDDRRNPLHVTAPLGRERTPRTPSPPSHKRGRVPGQEALRFRLRATRGLREGNRRIQLSKARRLLRCDFRMLQRDLISGKFRAGGLLGDPG
jgi:hypothetical protein